MEKMTDVELQIMECIWSIGADVSPSQVLTLLNERFHRGWTLQTLSTYMLRMAGKGYLTYQRKGRISIYHPLIARITILNVLPLTTQKFGEREF